MIEKDKRKYISQWFEDTEIFMEGDTLVFDMPSFCSGDYTATIHLDNDGDPYIDKKYNYYEGCRDLFI